MEKDQKKTQEILEHKKLEGKLIYTLEEGFEYAEKGDVSTAKRLVLCEPVKSSSGDCLVLAQIIRRLSVEAIKAFFGNDRPESKDKDGEEVIPFHRQDAPDLDKVVEEANGLVEMLMTSETDPQKFISAGKKILTTRYSNKEGRRLCCVDDGNETAFTGAMFDEMTVGDQLNLISVYASFFGISLIFQRRNISGRE